LGKILNVAMKYFLLLLSLFSLSGKGISRKADRPNILFLAIDDLRPDLGIYGNTIVQSPNIDRLATQGMYFTHHYVQVPTCGASRAALLTGLRPRNGVQINNNVFEKQTVGRPESARPESLVHQLKRNGYYTVGIGKISHAVDGRVYGYDEAPGDVMELPHSWNEFLFNPGKWKDGWDAFFGYASGESRQTMKGKVAPYERGNVDDMGYPDGLTAALAIEQLKKCSKTNQPFFLGVGFFKPHLPFTAPDAYWNLYNRQAMPLALSRTAPEGISLASLQNSSEFNSYKSGDEQVGLDHPLSEAYSKKLVHAYYAAISYVDAQVGKVLDELKRTGLDKNTIVVLWGDHGWHLGDHGVWGKHTLFEYSLKSPLIIKLPGKHSAKGAVANVIESIDLFPTLLEWCNVPLPYEMDGRSFSGRINGKSNKDEEVAYSYFNRGITLRTDRYRLTKYFRKEEPAIELYDHFADPGEQRNIAASAPDVVRQLMPLLEKGDTGLYK
jgi:arylsulfatase A-like enzyme